MIRILSRTAINLAVAGLLLLNTASSFAQPARAPEPAAPVQNKRADPAAAIPAGKSASAPNARQDRQPDTFVPSEEISEDLSVSFPEDI